MYGIKRKIKIMLGMVFGGLLFGGVALLIAPQSGEETRQIIKTKATNAFDYSRGRVVDLIEDIKGRAQHLTNGIGENAQRILNPQHTDRLVFKE